MHLSEPFSNFFSLPLVLYLYESVSQVLRAAAKHFGACGYAHTFSICPPPPAAKVPLPQRRRGFRHLSEGKIGFWVAVTAHRPRLFCSQCSASTGQGLRAEQRFELSIPKHSRRTHLSKTSVLSQQNKVFQEFQIGHLNGSQKHFNQINQSRATCKNWDSHFSIF